MPLNINDPESIMNFKELLIAFCKKNAHLLVFNKLKGQMLQYRSQKFSDALWLLINFRVSLIHNNKIITFNLLLLCTVLYHYIAIGSTL